MDLREPEEEILGQVGRAVPVQLPGPPGQNPSSRAAADQQRSKAIRAAITAVRGASPAAMGLPGRPAPKGSPAQRQHQSQKGSGAKEELPSTSGMERGMSAALMSPGREPKPAPRAQHGSPALTFATLIPQNSPLHARIAAQQVSNFCCSLCVCQTRFWSLLSGLGYHVGQLAGDTDNWVKDLVSARSVIHSTSTSSRSRSMPRLCKPFCDVC